MYLIFQNVSAIIASINLKLNLVNIDEVKNIFINVLVKNIYILNILFLFKGIVAWKLFVYVRRTRSTPPMRSVPWQCSAKRNDKREKILYSDNLER